MAKIRSKTQIKPVMKKQTTTAIIDRFSRITMSWIILLAAGLLTKILKFIKRLH